MVDLYEIEAEFTISVPANSEDQARESVRSWISEANTAIGGLSPHLDKMQVTDVYKSRDFTEENVGE